MTMFARARWAVLLWGVVAAGWAAVEAREGDSPPVYIDDARVHDRILAEATRMLEAGEACVPNEQLQQQLAKAPRTCALPVPPVVEDGGEAVKVYDRVRPGVLVVGDVYLCENCDHLHLNAASGFVVSADGLAITNHHVLANKDARTFVAATFDGRVVPVKEIVAANADDDVALIRLGGEGFAPLPIARAAAVGDTVHCLSHPDGSFYSYSKGVIARFFMEPAEQGDAVKRLGITADYARGSSGAPILNDRGHVVGVVTTTNSVYYDDEDGRKDDLQMVFKNCVPYERVLALFAAPAASPRAEPAPSAPAKD